MAVVGIIVLDKTVSFFLSYWVCYTLHVGQIKRNNVPDENLWSFGEVVPLVLLLGQLGELYDDIYNYFRPPTAEVTRTNHGEGEIFNIVHEEEEGNDLQSV